MLSSNCKLGGLKTLCKSTRDQLAFGLKTWRMRPPILLTPWLYSAGMMKVNDWSMSHEVKPGPEHPKGTLLIDWVLGSLRSELSAWTEN